MSVRIDRCICFDVAFATLKNLRSEGSAHPRGEIDVDDDCLRIFQKRARACGVPFGEKCRRCHPYVKEMLRSGQVLFDEILDDKPV